MAAISVVSDFFRRIVGGYGTGVFVRGREQPGAPNPYLLDKLLREEGIAKEPRARGVEIRDVIEALTLISSGQITASNVIVEGSYPNIGNPSDAEEAFSNINAGALGDVDGPAVSTDNAVTRFDGITGKIIQNSLAILDDLGNFTTPGTFDGRDVSVDGATLDAHVAASVAHAYRGIFSQPAAPATVQIPTSTWGFWFDTVNLTSFQVLNVSGTLYAVELTTPP